VALAMCFLLVRSTTGIASWVFSKTVNCGCKFIIDILNELTNFLWSLLQSFVKKFSYSPKIFLSNFPLQKSISPKNFPTYNFVRIPDRMAHSPAPTFSAGQAPGTVYGGKVINLPLLFNPMYTTHGPVQFVHFGLDYKTKTGAGKSASKHDRQSFFGS
jgi:hypothetical protein